jgi:urease accessory protein
MRAVSIKTASTWSGETLDSVVLNYDDRHRRRVAMTGTKGIAFLLDLPATAWLHGGDALVLEDGRLIEVIAAPESLLEIRGKDPLHLARLAWHLGNRHVLAQVLGKSLRIRRDDVIAQMAIQLGADVIEIEAPFDPEGGAYAVAADHHRHEARDNGHPRHPHSHDHGHGHDHGR